MASPPVPDAEKPAEDAGNVADGSIVEEITPASFTSMFRFSTPPELFLDFIGLLCAGASGAALPLMTLLFGAITQDFIAFEYAVAQLDPNNPSSEAAFASAAAHFKRNASSSAATLTYIGVGMFAAVFIYMYTWVYTGELNAKRLREHYLRAVLRQDVAYFDTVGAGEVATRIQTDTHFVQQGTSEKVGHVVGYVCAFLTGFVLAFARNWRLALALSSTVPCIGAIGVVMSGALSRYKQRSLKHIAESGSFAEEIVSTVRTAQAFGTQTVLADLYDVHIDQAWHAEHLGAVWSGGCLAVFFFVSYSCYALAFQFGTTLINEGHANGGQVVNVFLAVFVGSFSLVMMAPEMQAITDARAAAAKLFATIDRVPPIDSSDPTGLIPDTVHGTIEFDQVDFSYPSRPSVPIVKNLSLSFPAGKTCALVGASGSGKSTLVSLIERFYDPRRGAIRLDGVDVTALNLKWLRSQIGLVSQEPTLFAATIRANVAHGLVGPRWAGLSADAQLARVRAACVTANADAFIAELPRGYDTLVGERGLLLSGGQKQRIAIARAIVADPRILLLDEATSALDTESEGIVQSALDRAAAGRTTVTIAHRLSTVRGADVIYVMGGGAVLEQGTHHALLRHADGPYACLVAAQALRETQRGPGLAAEHSGASGPATDADYETRTRGEIPRGRSRPSQSLAHDVPHRPPPRTENDADGDLSIPVLLKRMVLLNRPGWRLYGFGALFAIMTGAVYPCFGVLFAKGIEGFTQLDPHQRRVDGDRTALYFFITALIAMFTVGMQNYLFADAAAGLTQTLRKLVFRAVLRQDIAYFDHDGHSTGRIVSALSDDPQKFNGLAGVTVGAIIQAASTVVVGTILGLIFAWKIGIVGFACAPLLILSGYIRLRVVVLKDQKNKKAHEESAQLACEAAGSIRTVAALTREDDCVQMYSRSLAGPLRASNRSALPSNLLYGSRSLSFFVIALVFWYGAVLVAERAYTTFEFFVGLMSTTFSAIQAGGIFSLSPDMSSAKSAGSNILRLLGLRPDIDAESTEGTTPQRVQGRVQFTDVHFRYPTRPGVSVLQGLNLTVEPGSYIALVGASGCGKSTVIQLIERFYDPLAGHISLDGQVISDLNIQEYRKHIALVSQEPTLYAGTVRFNILLGATKPESEVTQEQIADACRKANILEFIESLPDGFDTQVGGKGSQLSGGQKQRIAIARALLRNPEVLLLDEATSALDSASEKVVQTALDQAARGRTTIAVAHRLSTIQNADCIYFIQDGAVLERGTHDELISRKGAYYKYVQLQTLSHL